MKTLVDNFRVATNQYPDKAALIQGDKIITYKELNDLIDKIATILQKNGLKKGDRVALVVENCPEYAAIYYGVLVVGGVVVALNTAAQLSDINNWVEHAGAEFVFAKPDVLKLDSLNHNEVSLISYGKGKYQFISCLDDISYISSVYKEQLLGGNELAAIIYTSGTTGDPKGVVLSHKNLVSNMASICEYLPIEADDRVVNVLPFYYSYGNSVLHTNLGVGATIILENSMMFPVKVVESIQKNRATAFYGVASTYALLLSRTNLENYDLSSLRYVTQAGGPMPPVHIKQIMKIVSQIKFFMMYGQTEGTARLGYIPSELIYDKLGSAGKAIPGVTLEIRNEDGKVMLEGEEGEIYAKGDNIMLGYWNNPEMTKDILIDGWLRTGDIARMDSDGYVYMAGRRSDMIKSGANRISPKEIEEKLAELDDIEESAAIGKSDEILGQAIKVYVVKREGSEITKQKIMKHCKNRLAQYKMPKEIEFITQLPKTASGKLQRFKLL